MATASPLEVAWTAVAVIGLLFSLWATLEGHLDLRAIRIMAGRPSPRVRIGGPRWWIALGNLVSSLLWVIVWSGFTFVGTIAMRTPPNPALVRAAQDDDTGWALVCLVAVLAAIQAWNRYVRIRLRRFTISAQGRRA